MKASRQAFVLVEVLPALVLFCLTLTIATRYLHHATESVLACEQARYREAALEMTMGTWLTGPGLLAIAHREPVGGWIINTFPDETWIPAGIKPEVRHLRSASESIILRRRKAVDLDGRQRWEISECRAGPDGEFVWIFLMTVTDGL